MKRAGPGAPSRRACPAQPCVPPAPLSSALPLGSRARLAVEAPRPLSSRCRAPSPQPGPSGFPASCTRARGGHIRVSAHPGGAGASPEPTPVARGPAGDHRGRAGRPRAPCEERGPGVLPRHRDRADPGPVRPQWVWPASGARLRQAVLEEQASPTAAQAWPVCPQRQGLHRSPSPALCLSRRPLLTVRRPLKSFRATWPVWLSG